MNKEIMEELKKRKEIDPYEHNKCYELVQETVTLYSKNPILNYSYTDLDLIYLMTIGTWKSSIENKISKVKKSNLKSEDKEKLIELLIKIKGEEEYTGMFGTGFFTFDKQNSLEESDVRELIEILIRVNKITDENEAIKFIDNSITKNYKGVGLGTLSQILHCLKPFCFPILNSAGRDIYKKFGIKITNNNDITEYANLTKTIKEFRDNNFDFKNYRVFDLEAYGEYIQKDSIEVNATNNKDDEAYNGDEKNKENDTVKESNVNSSKQNINGSGLKEADRLEVDFEEQFKFSDTSLVFEEGILKALESQISIALRNEKNIILIGPPGTGKSKLAKEICNHYRKSEYNLITANSDWSTFDTIGGYKPQKDGSLKFQPGLFLKQFKNNKMNINRWLIIDEINRADIDKAFGAFFSALAGDQVNLSFEDEKGENIVISNNESNYKEHHYLIHNDWRLIATMNTLDKTSLYEMSYAFMRRFAFISVPSPRNISNELIHQYLSVWNIDNKEYVEDIKNVWELINDYRKIGPALIEDFYKYLVASEGDYASAINMFVIPQLEGVYDDKIVELRKKLLEFEFIKGKDMLEDFINNFFMLEE